MRYFVFIVFSLVVSQSDAVLVSTKEIGSPWTYDDMDHGTTRVGFQSKASASTLDKKVQALVEKIHGKQAPHGGIDGRYMGLLLEGEEGAQKAYTLLRNHPLKNHPRVYALWIETVGWKDGFWKAEKELIQFPTQYSYQSKTYRIQEKDKAESYYQLAWRAFFDEKKTKIVPFSKVEDYLKKAIAAKHPQAPEVLAEMKKTFSVQDDQGADIAFEILDALGRHKQNIPLPEKVDMGEGEDKKAAELFYDRLTLLGNESHHTVYYKTKNDILGDTVLSYPNRAYSPSDSYKRIFPSKSFSMTLESRSTLLFKTPDGTFRIEQLEFKEGEQNRFRIRKL